MSNLTKILIGAGITLVGVGVTAYYGKKLVDKKKTAVIKGFDEQGNPVIEEVKEETFMERIKIAAYKKAIRILGWAMLHQKQIETVGTVIGVGSAIFSAVTAIRDFSSGVKKQKQINAIASQQQEILQWLSDFQTEWNEYMEATNHNVQWFEQKAKDIHLDMSSLHQIEEALIPAAV